MLCELIQGFYAAFADHHAFDCVSNVTIHNQNMHDCASNGKQKCPIMRFCNQRHCVDSYMMDNVREIIAANILFYRKKVGFTQTEMANNAKISLRTVQRAEDPGAGGMDVDIILAIAAAIGVHPSKLMLAPDERIPVSAEEALEVLAKAISAPVRSPRIAALLSAIDRDPTILDDLEVTLATASSADDHDKRRPARKAR